MKYKTTALALKNGYNRIVAVGYCSLQNLLNYRSPIAYCRGVYGWNFDVYEVDGVAIATGYRGMPSKNTSVSYDLVQKYEDLAEGKTKEERDVLLSAFIREVSKCDK